MADEKTIPADDALAALNDDALLGLLEAHGIDASGIGDREGAIAALKLKRDTPPEQGGEQAAPPPPPAPEDPQNPPAPAIPPVETEPPAEPPEDTEQDSIELDTRADLDEQKYERPRFSAMVAQAVRDAAGDAPCHAALHNFEVALADFRKAAQNVSDQGQLEEDSDVAHLVHDILSFF